MRDLHRSSRLSFVLVLLVGCGSKAPDESSGTVIVSTVYPIALEFRAPDRVRAGRSVPLKLTLRNVGPDSALVILGGRPVDYDFIVTGPNGKEVWSTERAGAVAIAQEKNLAPGGVLHF